MNHKELYNLLKTVKKNIRCPQCGKQYEFSQIRIKGIAEFVVFLELSCTDHMPVLATVALSNQNAIVTEQESGLAVDQNDVIDTYQFLEKFKGGFDKYFQKDNK